MQSVSEHSKVPGRLRFILIKESMPDGAGHADAPHFAGGKHAFGCIAKSLAADGHEVHLVTTSSSKARVMQGALAGGYLHKLSYSAPHVITWCQLVGRQECQWRQPSPWATTEDTSLTIHVCLRGGDGQRTEASPAPTTAQAGGGRDGQLPVRDAAVVHIAAGLAELHPSAAIWMIVDADESQHARLVDPGHGGMPPQLQQLPLQPQQALDAAQQPQQDSAPLWGGALEHAAQLPQQGSLPPGSGTAEHVVQVRQWAPTLLEALVVRHAARLLVLVQNVHHLPFGPAGCAPRAPSLLCAWRRAAGILTVSRYLEQYVRTHGPFRGVGGFKDREPSAPRVRVVPLSAWGVYGCGPFEDLGEALASRLPPEDGHAVGRGGPARAGSGTLSPEDAPVVGMLKLTADKGSALFLALTERLGSQGQGKDVQRLQAQPQLREGKEQLQQQSHPVQQQLQPRAWPAVQEGLHGESPQPGVASLPPLSFLAVTEDPQLHREAAAGQLPAGLTLLRPQADLDAPLRRMWVVLVPSALREAWGMVVVDAMLRGVPVLVADAGALPEAGLGAARVLPTRLAAFPLDPASGAPAFRDRMHAPPAAEHVEAWAAALAALLRSREAYAAASSAARHAALAHVAEGPRERVAFMEWLQGLA